VRANLGLCACAFLLGACDEPIKEPQRIENHRVLGARVEPLADPTRASLLPGETARVRWLVADPQPARPLGWAFGVCPAIGVSSGLPRCGGPFIAEAISAEPRAEEPEFELVVPTREELGTFAELVVLGVICADGQPSSADSSCAGPGVEATRVDFYLRVPAAGEPNHNPSLADAELSWDGMPWTAPTSELLSQTDCALATEDVPRVGRGSTGHAIRAAVADGDREALSSANALDPHRETLALSHFATAGELARPVSILEPTDATNTLAVTWDAPETAPSEGTLARFYFVARDLRGGVDWTERVVCVEP
jgi:hypothetical protein